MMMGGGDLLVKITIYIQFKTFSNELVMNRGGTFYRKTL